MFSSLLAVLVSLVAFAQPASADSWDKGGILTVLPIVFIGSLLVWAAGYALRGPSSGPL